MTKKYSHIRLNLQLMLLFITYSHIQLLSSTFGWISRIKHNHNTSKTIFQDVRFYLTFFWALTCTCFVPLTSNIGTFLEVSCLGREKGLVTEKSTEILLQLLNLKVALQLRPLPLFWFGSLVTLHTWQLQLRPLMLLLLHF